MLTEEFEFENYKIVVEYDYSPSEPMTRDYPGCDEEFEICGVTLVPTRLVNSFTLDECFLDDDKIISCLMGRHSDYAKSAEEARADFLFEQERERRLGL